jgi:phenylpyruvate tautomerase PptA (4-oxalocrotonate tautomerase family)
VTPSIAAGSLTRFSAPWSTPSTCPSRIVSKPSPPTRPADLICDASYLNIPRSAAFIAIEITLRRGRTPTRKRALYRAIAENIRDATGTPIEDVMVVLTENDPIDWSFGGGIAQYSPAGASDD